MNMDIGGKVICCYEPLSDVPVDVARSNIRILLSAYNISVNSYNPIPVSFTDTFDPSRV